MEEQQPSGSVGSERGEEPVPIIQELFDNIWFLFFVSAVIVLVSYIIWGMIDLLSVQVSP